MSLDEPEQFKVITHLPGDETTSSRNTPRQQRVVTFPVEDDDLRKVQYIAPITEWSEEEHSSRWYTSCEYGNFRRDVFATLYLLRNRPEELDDGVSNTARGIECRDPVLVGRRQHVKQLAWQVVFDEQEALRKDQEGDRRQAEDWMATLYRNAAGPALREALDLAALDEREASKIHKENDAKEGLGDDNSFSDDWISSISSHSSSTATKDFSAGASKQVTDDDDEESGFCVFGAASGFDDDWIRGG